MSICYLQLRYLYTFTKYKTEINYRNHKKYKVGVHLVNRPEIPGQRGIKASTTSLCNPHCKLQPDSYEDDE